MGSKAKPPRQDRWAGSILSFAMPDARKDHKRGHATIHHIKKLLETQGIDFS
jgi:hypothetical protein